MQLVGVFLLGENLFYLFGLCVRPNSPYFRLFSGLTKSKDVVFLKDQIIEDIDKYDKRRSLNDIPISSYSDPVPLPINYDHGGAKTE